MSSLVGSAIWYAKRGVPVFALQARSKIPRAKSHGFEDATTDVEQIREWWQRWPDGNIGLATGHVFDAVDIDGPEGQRSRVRNYCASVCVERGAACNGECEGCELGPFARIDRDALAKVLTPRDGGMHIYVPPTGDGNRAGIFPGIDYRGLGGYVVAPPSVTDVGEYRFLGEPKL